MEQRNVTVTLPVDVLRAARHKAVDRGVSLSRFVADVLTMAVSEDSNYDAAMKRQRALMREGLALGFKGKVPWTRDELHAR
jgi:hypothetical protein